MLVARLQIEMTEPNNRTHTNTAVACIISLRNYPIITSRDDRMRQQKIDFPKVRERNAREERVLTCRSKEKMKPTTSKKKKFATESFARARTVIIFIMPTM